MASERERLNWLEQTYGENGPGLVGIGDDGAYLTLDAPHLVASVDAAIESVHFRQTWLDWDAVAFRAVQAALSDLAAMGASPAAILSSASLPPNFSEAAFAALARGTARSAKHSGARLIGGNLSSGPHVELHTTVIGHVPKAEALLTRRGASPGDTVWVTGPLGAAALGLRVLEHLLPSRHADEDPFCHHPQPQRGEQSDSAAIPEVPHGQARVPIPNDGYARSQIETCLASSGIPERLRWLARACVARWQTPSARIEAGLALRLCASAAIDLSDGLSSDAAALARASGIMLLVDQPLPAPTFARTTGASVRTATAGLCASLAAELGADWTHLQAHGGEDYELLFTLPPDTEPPCAAFRIGRCLPGPATVNFIEPRLRQTRPLGFDHFL